jgi:putative ABC transport system substrate-binding protein
MRLTRLAALATVAILAAPFAQAQPPKLYRVGYLGTDALVPTNPGWQGFLRALREQGYAEGQNLSIEYRSAEGRNEAYPVLAAELVQLRVDVIVAHGGRAVLAAKQATSTIPIVLFNVADPVGTGLVVSLAHPGGNVTGVSSQGADFDGKLVELARAAVPRLTRIAAISSATNPAHTPLVKEWRRPPRRWGSRWTHSPFASPRTFSCLSR